MTFARRLYVEQPNGVPVLAYDPRIGDALRDVGPGPSDLWALYRALQPIPTLLVRGAISDILAPATVSKMRDVKPDLRVTEVPGIGHAPMLDEPRRYRPLMGS